MPSWYHNPLDVLFHSFVHSYICTYPMFHSFCLVFPPNASVLYCNFHFQNLGTLEATVILFSQENSRSHRPWRFYYNITKGARLTKNSKICRNVVRIPRIMTTVKCIANALCSKLHWPGGRGRELQPQFSLQGRPQLDWDSLPLSRSGSSPVNYNC